MPNFIVLPLSRCGRVLHNCGASGRRAAPSVRPPGPNDRFDEIDPGEMTRNVAARAVLTWLLADSDGYFRP